VRGNQQLNCPIVEGYKSVTALHLGNIAWRVRAGIEIVILRTATFWMIPMP
jgi:hypothetical protein